MKQYLYLLILLPLFGLCVSTHAQTTGQNYIVTTVPYQAVSNPTTLANTNANTAIQYYDGLGRPFQTVQVNITPTGADLTSGVTYDSFDRDSLKWLPGATAVGNNGALISNSNYVSSASSTNGGDAKPYSRTDYEASPLNRVVDQYGPGADWYNNSKNKTTTYIANASDVKFFVANSTTLTCSGIYAPATLYGVQTTDEDGHTVVEYTDMQGRKVLSRVNGCYDTYFVYDDLDNLRYVLPPLASDALSTNTTGFPETTGSTLDLYGYIYHYDGWKRCIQKKLPGCDWIDMVYDLSSRLILSQDGNQRLKNQWTVNKYDVFGRLLYSGVLYSTYTLSQMQNTCSGSVIAESYTGSGTTGGYSCTILPPSKLLTVNYYDNYKYLNLFSTIKSQLTFTTPSGYTAPDTTRTKTLLTGTCVYHLNDSTKSEVTAIYYDKYGHPVQTLATNHLGGYDMVYNYVDFTGKPLSTMKTHGINGTTVSTTEVYAYTYDKAQRLLTTTHSLNGATTPVTLLTNTYDPLGRVATKTVGGTLNATTYSYNVRSWLTGITGSRFTENLYYEAPQSLSGFSACYNGNIAAIQWSVAAENLGYNRGYVFSYDGLNRLTTAGYLGNSTTNGYYNESMTYDKMGNFLTLNRSGTNGQSNQLSFICNGNQLQSVTDALSPSVIYGSEIFVNRVKTGTEYTYDKNGSMTYDGNSGISTIRYNLLNLPDTIQFTLGHQNRYTYSAGGAKLEQVNYTLNNLTTIPQGSIAPLPSSSTAYVKTVTDYVGDMIYQNGSLKEILTPEGYIENGVYYYYLQDHQGNNRVVINSSGAVQEYSHYYPDGMRYIPESSTNAAAIPYRYNNKEFEAMNGLNQYDYGARRKYSWGSVLPTRDPLCELYYSISPYAYCANNPIKLIDNNGLWPTKQVVDNGIVGHRGFSLAPVMNPYHKVMRAHKGQDFPTPEGNIVHALAEGIVTKIGWDKKGWGNYVEITHSDGYKTRYAHLQNGGIKVKKGDNISNGE